MSKPYLVEFFGWAILFLIIFLLQRKGKLKLPQSGNERKQLLIQALILIIIVAIFSFVYGEIVSFIQMSYLNKFSYAEFVLGIPLLGFLLPGIFVSIALIAITILNFEYIVNEEITKSTFLRRKFYEFRKDCIKDTIQLGVPKIILKIFFYLIIILSIFYTIVLFNSYVIVNKDGILYNKMFNPKFYQWNNVKSIKPFATSYKVFFDDGTEWNLHRLYCRTTLDTKAKQAIAFIEKQIGKKN